ARSIIKASSQDSGGEMSVVAITGVSGSLAKRLLVALEADASVERVVGVDIAEPATGTPKLDFHELDVRDARLAKLLVGVDVFGPEVENFVSRMMEAPRLTTVRGHEPPLQLVHSDDVVDALLLAVRRDLNGVYNLSADGWLSADEVVALSGKKRVELPEAVAFSMAERLWKTGLTTAPPGELHYLMHPWVVDSSKLRAAGWTPRYSNREALLETIESHRNW